MSFRACDRSACACASDLDAVSRPVLVDWMSFCACVSFAVLSLNVALAESMADWFALMSDFAASSSFAVADCAA